MSERPSATLSALRERQAMLTSTRTFFRERGVLEVTTPVLSRYASADPHVPSMKIHGQAHFLRTSPESALKRLLCAGAGDVFEIGPAFRAHELGALHQPEFTLLEWYRLGFNHHSLMDEVASLMAALGSTRTFTRLSYEDLFAEVCGESFIEMHPEQLAALAAPFVDSVCPTQSSADLHNLIYLHRLEPALKSRGAVFLHDYPPALRCYARLNAARSTAERFELIIDGLEIANGYHEIVSVDEQRACFDSENERRAENGLDPVIPDGDWLAALSTGLPPCAGVAVGVERLQMALSEYRDINQTISFSYENT